AEEGKSILLVTEKGYGKRVNPDEFRSHGRGTGGQRCYGNTESRGEIIGALSVADGDEVLCITSQGKTLRVAAKDIREQGNASTGVAVVNVDAPDYLVGIDKVADDENTIQTTSSIM
ncbi:MAG: DNA gyrase subunit A, partial [Treponema sp.]|nr:DNA gyrase subunit A [Treponema sp.]